MRQSLIIIFVFISIVLDAQTYKPMLVEGNSWNVLHYGYDYNYTQLLKVSTDTFINNIKYSKIISSYDSLSSIWTTTGYMREDTVKQKVYFLNIDTNAIERVYFEFNVKINDTIQVFGNKNVNYIRFNQIKLVDSVKIGSGYNKRIFVDYKISYGNILAADSVSHYVWIEGIGGLCGPLSSSQIPNISDPTKLLWVNLKDRR